MTLEATTTALRRALDKLEHPERPSVPPSAAVVLTPERIAEIETITRKSNAILSLYGLNGVTPGELIAALEAAKKGLGK